MGIVRPMGCIPILVATLMAPVALSAGTVRIRLRFLLAGARGKKNGQARREGPGLSKFGLGKEEKPTRSAVHFHPTISFLRRPSRGQNICVFLLAAPQKRSRPGGRSRVCLLSGWKRRRNQPVCSPHQYIRTSRGPGSREESGSPVPLIAAVQKRSEPGGRVRARPKLGLGKEEKPTRSAVHTDTTICFGREAYSKAKKMRRGGRIFFARSRRRADCCGPMVPACDRAEATSRATG
ncbi:MAG: hypothetical protein BWX88_02829 [Planctomycetes bacterium ADurb.Bin126]|nr:MAG: hypothetical protein BWX88_02829 [Planctomycetes bacterium ADurb.Bin126]